MKIEVLTEKERARFAEMEREIFNEISFFSKIPLPKQRHCFVVNGGYALIDLIEDEAELLQIGVLPLFRRKGIGGALLNEVIAYLKNEQVSRLFLEVRESNCVAQALYKSYGFKESGRRKGYYKSPNEDALNFMLILIDRH